MAVVVLLLQLTVLCKGAVSLFGRSLCGGHSHGGGGGDGGIADAFEEWEVCKQYFLFAMYSLFSSLKSLWPGASLLLVKVPQCSVCFMNYGRSSLATGIPSSNFSVSRRGSRSRTA